MDGSVIALADDGLHNVASGADRWRAAGAFEGPPVVARDGTIYVSSTTGLVALTAEGAEKWRVPAVVGSRGAALADDGTIYAAGKFGHASDLFALRTDGSILWRLPMDGAVASGPAIGADGTVYVATATADDAGTVYAVAQPHGPLMQSSWPKVHGGPGNTNRAYAPAP